MAAESEKLRLKDRLKYEKVTLEGKLAAMERKLQAMQDATATRK